MRIPSAYVWTVAFVIVVAGCSKNSTGPQTEMPPWDIGQSAEAVLGQSDFTSTGTITMGQSSTNKPWGLAVSSDGTLFVVDQLYANRILRFDHATSKANGATADGVLGQADFVTSAANYGVGGSTPSARGFDAPTSVALDAAGNLYMVDQGNGRVLRFNAAASKANGAAADAVFGKPDFVTKGFGTTASQFFTPQAVTVDASGTMYVADGSNNRVLRFNNAATKSSGANADGVLGQPDFTTNTVGTSATKMANPISVAVDKSGNLYVGERGNSRVLIFLNAASKANGAAADIVLGKADFGDGSTPSSATSSVIYYPYAMAVDEKNDLYVADGAYNRVLIFYNAPSKSNNAAADAVIGKKDFTSSSVTAAAVDNIGQPFGVAVESMTGKLFVSCYSNSRILRFQAKSSLR